MPKVKKTRSKKTLPEVPTQPPQDYKAAARRWLWIWVSLFSILIIGLWGWAAKINLSSFSWHKTPEKQLLDNRQNDWDRLFNTETDRIKNERLKNQMKTVLNKIIAESTSSTISTTTTVSTSTAPITSSTTSTL